jgi:hypothetical protein
MRRKLYSFETVANLKTDGQFRRAYQRNREDHSKLNTAFIDAGRGHWRNAEIAAAAKNGDKLSLDHEALTAESYALGHRAESWFGREPYLI